MIKMARAYFLIELGVALSLLMIILAAASFALHNSYLHQAVLWEELIANELAVSALERAVAEDRLACTPAEGRPLDAHPEQELAGSTTPPLQGLALTLYVEKVPGQAGLAEVRVAVAWQRTLGPLAGQQVRIERRLRRRVAQ
jgi:type II secretory pathway pseudopilin PulG